jgi:hypothetical protein
MNFNTIIERIGRIGRMVPIQTHVNVYTRSEGHEYRS